MKFDCNQPPDSACIRFKNEVGKKRWNKKNKRLLLNEESEFFADPIFFGVGSGHLDKNVPGRNEEAEGKETGRVTR